MTSSWMSQLESLGMDCKEKILESSILSTSLLGADIVLSLCRSGGEMNKEDRERTETLEINIHCPGGSTNL